METLSQWKEQWQSRASRPPPPQYADAENANDSEASLLSIQEPVHLEKQKSPNIDISRFLVSGFWIKCLFGVLVVGLYTFLLLTFVPRSCSEKDCNSRTMLWCKSLPLPPFDLFNTESAPLNDAVQYLEYDFDTAFDQKSKYRGPPTEKLEGGLE